ncbi:RNA-directed DNA polymerase, eukaryota [Tanacetum coccineum]|uniref:RNA-directed DNA polymerase, eukaryota n=1 Tax=Tanacetum coccineum TaxID=301880 RepID=A0ABQ4X1T3_9ASTR
MKISKSIFVTNFPEGCSARDLWKVCNDYGMVVDVFIPFKKLKAAFPLWERLKMLLLSLTIILSNEGFHNIKLSYLGGMWILLELDDTQAKEKLLNHTDRFIMGEIVELEDLDSKSLSIFWIHAKELNARVPTFLEDNQEYYSSDDESEENVVADIDGDTENNNLSDVDRVSESIFSDVNNFVHENSCNNKSGFTPVINKGDNIDVANLNAINEQVHCLSSKLKERNMKDSVSSHNSMNTCSLKNNACGSILDVMDELVKIGQTIGLGNKTKKGWIRELCQKHIINFVSIQETKMEFIDLFSIKALWGDLNFDHVVSPSVSFSGGIVCVWDPSMFIKDYVSKYDYFVAIMGTWTSTSTKLLIISIYAPQESTEKRDLWNYLRSLIDIWEGETVIMRYFNEVCLIDLPFEGYTYTWAHKSASKMSKLDRFLISDGLLLLFLHLSALCLDRHLSDHRAILLKESSFDFGPTPFLIFHSWFSMEGFGSFVETTWKSINFIEPNGLIRMKRSCKSLKLPSRFGQKRLEFDLMKQFSLPNTPHFCFDYVFPNRLSTNQVEDLEHIVTYDKVSWLFRIVGLKQGDPISPFLSILIMETLHLSFTSVIKEGLFKGLKINLYKSKLVGVGINLADVDRAATSIGCSTFSTPFKYLSVKVGDNMSRVNSWEDVIFKVSTRLSKWKLKTILIGGRLTLLKSVVSSGPLYHMSIYKVPIGVLNKLESIRRNFFNGVDGSDNKIAWIGWDKIWRFLTQESSWWTCFIKVVHDASGLFSVKSTRHLIDDNLLPKVNVPTRWVKVIPIKLIKLEAKSCVGGSWKILLSTVMVGFCGFCVGVFVIAAAGEEERVKWGVWYGYIKNHKKTVKNGQARTRERKSEQKPEASQEKVNPQSNSVKHGKLRTRWYGPYTVSKVYPYGTVEVLGRNGVRFKVNGHRVKKYHGHEDPEAMRQLSIPARLIFICYAVTMKIHKYGMKITYIWKLYEGSIPINRGLIQAIPTSLPPQPIGEATKASTLRRIPPGVQGRSHFT